MESGEEEEGMNMTLLDQMIDMLMAERAEVEKRGLRQNKEDEQMLLKLLLEDVRRNPDQYAR